MVRRTLPLVSEITFSLKCKWSKDSTSPNTLNLEITGSMTAGGAQGTGKLVLRPDKTLDRLSAQGGVKTSARKVKSTSLLTSKSVDLLKIYLVTSITRSMTCLYGSEDTLTAP